ncbi:hypothetical protein OSR40_005500 [Serratia rubidaea]|uniref:hypothetical protein n=1 Tax=Serratia rubidaea TaxID=61652 RepID=UPI0023AFEAAD|nr:hypothetical protein [Serratia rubidaea]MDK1703190.1 hypothetical protein [Serratia rubidaea]
MQKTTGIAVPAGADTQFFAVFAGKIDGGDNIFTARRPYDKFGKTMKISSVPTRLSVPAGIFGVITGANLSGHLATEYAVVVSGTVQRKFCHGLVTFVAEC